LLVRTSALLAAETVIRVFLQRLLPSDTREFFEISSANYDASHRVSAIVAFILNHPLGEGLAKDPKFGFVPRQVARMLEDARESRLSPDQLAKLPREAIVAFDYFQAEHAQMCQIASLWSDYFERSERSWMNSEAVHGQWRSLQRFIEQAKAVRAILVKHGAATSRESEKLFASQISTLKLGVMAGLSDKPKLAAAASELPV
jgi:hypothetical protein